MSDNKHRLPGEEARILTFQPKLPEGRAAPDPMVPPPFAARKPKPAGEAPKTATTASGQTKKPK